MQNVIIVFISIIFMLSTVGSSNNTTAPDYSPITDLLTSISDSLSDSVSLIIDYLTYPVVRTLHITISVFLRITSLFSNLMNSMLSILYILIDVFNTSLFLIFLHELRFVVVLTLFLIFDVIMRIYSLIPTSGGGSVK